MIHQVYITNTPSQVILDKINLVKAKYEHTLWGDAEIRQLLKDHFEPEVIWAYDELVPFSYKSDLARYAIMYIHGGWYLDVAFELMVPLPDVEFMFFRDMVPTYTAIGMFYSKKENPIFRQAIDVIIDNCKSKFYGNHPVDCTGPGVIGKVLNYSTADCVGDLKIVNDHFCFTILNLVVAVGKKARQEGGLHSLGDSSGGNYFQLWHDKKVYRSDLEF